MRKLTRAELKLSSIDEDQLPTWVTWVLRGLVLYSVATYLIEIEWLHSEHSRAGLPFFLWSERVVATIFTAEVFYRFWYSKKVQGENPWKDYLWSFRGVIDLLSILPFWIGFFVPTGWLHIIRTLRVFRLAKFYRYSPALQNLIWGFRKEKRRLRTLGELALFVVFFGSVLMYEIERFAQPDKFGTILNATWWLMVTMTTIGYGDTYPITPLGKLVASLLMVVGVGIFGAFLGIMGSACLRSQESGEE